MDSRFNLNSLFVMVRDWNKRTGHMPDVDAEANAQWFFDEEYRDRAMDLLTEEVGEMKHAIDSMNQVEMLDAAADIIFVLAGIIEKAGLGEYMDDAMVEVLKSNNSKISPNGEVVRDANGKIGKPEHYRPPNIQEAMRLVDKRNEFRRYDSAETDD